MLNKGVTLLCRSKMLSEISSLLNIQHLSSLKEILKLLCRSYGKKQDRLENKIQNN